MAKTRLTVSGRDYLTALVREIVLSPVEGMMERNTYAAAAPLVRALVEAEYPPADMSVLKRYNTACEDHCIKVKLADGCVTMFTFYKDDNAPLRPGNQGCHSRLYLADEITSVAVERHVRAVEAHKAELKRKHEDYVSLIYASRYFEDVVAVWPEAEAARTRCGAAAMTVAVTDDVLARIRADVAARQDQPAMPEMVLAET